MDPLGNRPVGSPADVERQLSEFWRDASTQEQAVTRACSMNLVVVCNEEAEDLRRATELIASIAETVPGRALVVGPPGGDPTRLDVYVSAHCHRSRSGAYICSEQVTIEPGGASLDRVPGTLLQLLVEEMPVYTWWRRRDLDPCELVDPLLDLSDYWMLDAALAASPEKCLESIIRLSSRATWAGHVIDAAWVRLASWRDALASFFDDPARRPALDRVERFEVEAGGRVAQAYLAGWLVSRLGFRETDDSRWARPDGTPVELALSPRRELPAGEVASARIEAMDDDGAIVFDARVTGKRGDGLSLNVTVEGRTVSTRRIRRPALDEASTMCGLLQRTGRDEVFEEALACAARIVGSS
jgi:glucose-6-phosphate dehydrogenase assembly protein OpcA